jgi:hypothetical protein
VLCTSIRNIYKVGNAIKNTRLIGGETMKELEPEKLDIVDPGVDGSLLHWILAE